MFFFTGICSNQYHNTLLKEEAKLFNDIIQISYHESYFNLTILTIWMIKWVIDFCYFNYFIKNDEDVIPNINLINRWLRNMKLSNCSYGIVSNGIKVVRNNKSSRYIPYISYNRSKLPCYVYGYFAIYNYYHLKELNKISFTSYPIIYREDIHIGYLTEKIKASFCSLKYKIIQYDKITRNTNLNNIVAIHGVVDNYYITFNAFNV